ncbi:MAG TPA: hypothetical protein VD929_01305 [Caulobacteraceae bacterium]|nr:hypothetical protein [Caulobacteraceae bacterium]
MADGFTIQIEGDLAERLKAAAEAAGRPVEALARDMLEQHLLEEGDELGPADLAYDPETAEDARIVDEMIRTGGGTPWDIYEERMKRFGRPEPKG